jgi:hypothetical protein
VEIATGQQDDDGLSEHGHSLETGNPVVLFLVRIGGDELVLKKPQYDVSSDGQRFLGNLAVDEESTSPITLNYNWKPKP